MFLYSLIQYYIWLFGELLCTGRPIVYNANLGQLKNRTSLITHKGYPLVGNITKQLGHNGQVYRV